MVFAMTGSHEKRKREREGEGLLVGQMMVMKQGWVGAG